MHEINSSGCPPVIYVRINTNKQHKQYKKLFKNNAQTFSGKCRVVQPLTFTLGIITIKL